MFLDDHSKRMVTALKRVSLLEASIEGSPTFYSWESLAFSLSSLLASGSTQGISHLIAFLCFILTCYFFENFVLIYYSFVIFRFFMLIVDVIKSWTSSDCPFRESSRSFAQVLLLFAKACASFSRIILRVINLLTKTHCFS